jgi:hypothetical protein
MPANVVERALLTARLQISSADVEIELVGGDRDAGEIVNRACFVALPLAFTPSLRPRPNGEGQRAQWRVCVATLRCASLRRLSGGQP